ncbi:hypothetical protein F4778DRAFT_789362 [Xylariomycetidae sp. FL2044]|nr:hypothetical protein F4778DRAFT_789362 [Xylariomycetidae sp. FL2044]
MSDGKVEKPGQARTPGQRQASITNFLEMVKRSALEAAAMAKPTSKLHCDFGPWKDSSGQILPCHGTSGPGEIILPNNVRPGDVRLVKKEVEWYLNAEITWSNKGSHPGVKHNKIRVSPRKGAMKMMPPEAQAAFGWRAYRILAKWANDMHQCGKVLPLLDHVRNECLKEIVTAQDVASEWLRALNGKALYTKDEGGEVDKQETTSPVASSPSQESTVKTGASSPRDDKTTETTTTEPDLSPSRDLNEEHTCKDPERYNEVLTAVLESYSDPDKALLGEDQKKTWGQQVKTLPARLGHPPTIRDLLDNLEVVIIEPLLSCTTPTHKGDTTNQHHVVVFKAALEICKRLAAVFASEDELNTRAADLWGWAMLDLFKKGLLGRDVTAKHGTSTSADNGEIADLRVQERERGSEAAEKGDVKIPPRGRKAVRE